MSTQLFSIPELQKFTDKQLKAMELVCRQMLEGIWSDTATETIDEMIERVVSGNCLRARKAVKVVDALCSELGAIAVTNHHQISPETLEWGGYLSGNTFSTVDKDVIAELKGLVLKAI